MFSVVNKALLCVLLFLSFGLTGYAQRVDPPPQDAGRLYFTIFTHSDWEKRPDERQLVRNVDTAPLLDLKGKCHFNHYTESNPVFVAGRFWNISEKDFPVIVISRPTGGYFYKASGKNIPSSASGIFEEAKAAYYRDNEAQGNQAAIQAEEFDLVENCPDGICPTPQSPAARKPVFPNAPWNVDSNIEGLFSGGSPIRDSLAYVGWVIGAVIILFFLAIAFFGFMFVLAIAIYAFKK